MRILHVCKKYPNALGGDAVVVSNLEKIQRKLGNEVFIITSNCDEIIKKTNIIKFGVKINGRDLDKMNIRRIINLFLLFIYSFYIIRKLKPDIIHSHSADLGFVISFASRVYNIPIINTCHGVTFPYKTYPKLKRFMEKFFLKFGKFSKIITVDRSSIKYFMENGIRNVKFIPNGVETPIYHVHTKTSGIVRFLFVGRLEEQKGLKYLIYTIKILKDKLLKFEMCIVGDGSLKNEYENLVTDLGLDTVVKFLGKVSDKELSELYNSCDIFVLPSIWEGLPLTILEAWSYNLPVIVTNVGDIPFLCTNYRNAVIVEPAKVEKLAGAIEFLIENVKYRHKFGTLGYQKVLKYKWYNVTNEYMQVYEEVINDGKV